MNNWLKIKIGNQDEIDSSSITTDLKFLELTTTPVYANNYQTIQGINGSIYQSGQFNQSTVNLKFLVRFKNWQDLDLAKHDLYRFFMVKDIIRVRCSTAPNKVYYCRAMPFTIALAKVGDLGAVFTIPLDNPSGMAYSLVESDNFSNIQDNDNWSYGMNIPTGTELNYHYTNTNEFNIYNPSDIRINPYLQNDKLNIQIKFSGDNFTITNKTNGTTWTYNNKSDGTETILLSGVNTSTNGNPSSINTNYGHIELEKGNNDITISGSSSFDITFSFPFIYIA